MRAIDVMRPPYELRQLSGDIFGGVTTAATVLPMALAYGVATGLGAIAGMYGAIVVGFFASVFGGTPARIAYPSAAMAVAMMVVLTEHAESVSEAFTIIVMAGLIQIALGILRIGRFVTYTPYSMIAGFTSGIGVIIIVIQTLPFLGAAPAPGGLFDIIRAWPEALVTFNLHAVTVGIVSLAICVFWPRRLGRYLPGPLLALLVGTVIAMLWLPGAPVIGELPRGLPSLQAPEMSAGFLLSAIQPALTLALISSVNSMVASLVADSLTGTRHKPNREMAGQGIANVAAGLLGALPGAGAPSGTTVNIRAGGSSPVSGVLCAAALLAIVLGLGRIAEPIPLAVLSGILVKVGWDIIDWRLITRIRHVRRNYLLVMLLTLALTVFVDLITAIVVGLIVAGFARARESERRELSSVVSVPLLDTEFFSGGQDADDADVDRFAARVGLVDLRGEFSFASSNELAWTIGADIEQHEAVIFDFSNTVHMDDSAALVIERLIDRAAAAKTECIVLNLSGSVGDTLNSLNVFRRLPAERFVDGLESARELAVELLNDGDE
ncbi:MAG: SulP family inorganic anion transporter [Chloroflexi bacterium]|nr:SulP family inorganic anion transporter [Chloroflexota bacterium]MYD47715.1 SulP family inorganic anion transporter [Chloroflexota bacterium]